MAKYNWEEISKEYIEALSDAERPTLGAIAKRHGTTRNYVEQVASKQEWSRKAAEFLSQLSAKKKAMLESRLEQRLQARTEELIKFDSDCLRVARAIVSGIAQHFKEAQSSGKSLPINELFKASGTVLNAQRIGRIALDAEMTLDRAIATAQTSGYLVIDPTQIGIQPKALEQSNGTGDRGQKEAIQIEVIPPNLERRAKYGDSSTNPEA